MNQARFFRARGLKLYPKSQKVFCSILKKLALKLKPYQQNVFFAVLTKLNFRLCTNGNLIDYTELARLFQARSIF